MDRRSFVTAAGGTLAVGWAGFATAGSHADAASHHLRLGSSYVSNSELFVSRSQISAGDKLILRRKPDRIFDSLSIEVSTIDQDVIGYLPPVSSGTLAILMDSGFGAYGVTLNEAERGTALQLDVFLILPGGRHS